MSIEIKCIIQIAQKNTYCAHILTKCQIVIYIQKYLLISDFPKILYFILFIASDFLKVFFLNDNQTTSYYVYCNPQLYGLKLYWNSSVYT